MQKDLSSIFVLAVSLVLIVILTISFRRPLGPKIRVLGISLFVLFLGLFPYYVLGHVPTFTEWTSRHQILIPFGFSLLLAYSIGLIRSETLARKISVLLFLFSVAVSAFNSALFYADKQKQKSIQRFMETAFVKSKPGLVVIDDRTVNVLNRTYRFYEINGMLARATKTQSFFGIIPEQLAGYKKESLINIFLHAITLLTM